MSHEAHHDGGRVGELQVDLLRHEERRGARVELNRGGGVRSAVGGGEACLW